jgi:hypothetical protein
MAKRRHVLTEDLQQLLDLIHKGKLFALHQWIKDGKRIRSPEQTDCHAEILNEAVATGFHSLVEELLRAGGWSADELTDALEKARYHKRFDIAELLINHGAQVQQLDFQTSCEELDLPMMERHLRNGVDPGKDNAFARALSYVKARPLLGFYRQFHAEFPALQDQAALALSEAVQKNQVRWTALLAWAGADPFRHVPRDLDTPFPADAEDFTTAAGEAVWRNRPEILKVLHLKPTASQAIELLDQAVYTKNSDLIRSFLAIIPRDQVNKSPRGSSAALEKFVTLFGDVAAWSSNSPPEADAKTLQCIEALLDAGAKWNPPTADLRYARRALRNHDNRYIVQVLRLLLYTPGAADKAQFLELCRSQAFMAQIASVDPHLWEELKILRKEFVAANASGANASTETAQVAELQHTLS